MAMPNKLILTSQSNLSFTDPSPLPRGCDNVHMDKEGTLEETFKAFMQFSKQVLNDNTQLLARLDMQASELANGQENDFSSCYQENELRNVRSEEQIDDHVDMSNPSFKMSFESISSLYLIS